MDIPVYFFVTSVPIFSPCNIFNIFPSSNALNTIIGESFEEIYDRLSGVSIECMEEEVNTLIKEMLIENGYTINQDGTVSKSGLPDTEN